MRKITVLALLLAPCLAFAQAGSKDVSYHYLQLGLQNVNYDVPGPNIKGTGLSLDYSVEARPHVNLFALYDAFDFKDAGDTDGQRRGFGVGAHFSPTERFSIFGRFGYLNTDVDLGSGNVDRTGGLVGAGVRYMIGNGWEIRGGAEYADLDNGGSSTYYDLGGDMYMTDAIALSLDAADRDGSTAITLGLRFYFDKQSLRGETPHAGWRETRRQTAQ